MALSMVVMCVWSLILMTSFLSLLEIPAFKRRKSCFWVDLVCFNSSIVIATTVIVLLAKLEFVADVLKGLADGGG